MSHVEFMNGSIADDSSALPPMDLNFDFESFCHSHPIVPDALSNVDPSQLSGRQSEIYNQQPDPALCPPSENKPYTQDTYQGSSSNTSVRRPSVLVDSGSGNKRKASGPPRKDQTRKKKVKGNNSSEGSRRPHYAVEQRYRDSLNNKYAALSHTISQASVQRICRLPPSQLPDSKQSHQDSSETGDRQSKTTTLSIAIDTVRALSLSCSLKAKEVEELRQAVDQLQGRMQRLLTAKNPSLPPTPLSLSTSGSLV